MAKKVSIKADVNTTTLPVTVTAAPGSAGIAVPYTLASSLVNLSNTSSACALQYKVNSGDWISLNRDDCIELAVNLANDVLYLRRNGYEGGPATALLQIDDLGIGVGGLGAPRIAANRYGEPSISLGYGAVKSVAPRRQSRGAIISMTDGARGEAVLAETTPASGGSNAASSVSRFATPTRRVFCATDATSGVVRFNAPAGKSFGRFSANDSITVLMYVEACNSADSLQVTISADGMVNGSSVTIALNANKAPGYWFQSIDCSAFVGTTTLPASINSVRAKIIRSGAAQTAVHVCGVIHNQRHKPTIIIDFDDAFASQYTHAFQIMASYGLIGNVAVIERAVGKNAGDIDAYDYCTLQQLKDMQAAGWGMVTHGYYPHNQGGTMNTYALIKADVAANLAYVQANLPSDNALHYVLPAGQQHAATDQVLAELGFITCRGTIGQQTVEQPLGVDNPYRLFGANLSAQGGLADLKSKFDTARKCGSTIRFQGHRIVSSVVDAGNELLDTDFEAFCAYIAPYVQSGEVDNLTMAEWNAVRLR